MNPERYTILALFAACVILWLTRGCGDPQPCDIDPQGTTVFIYDTTRVEVVRYVPQPSDTVTVTNFDTVTDTVQIVQRWERELVVYNDTIADTNLRAFITDSIYQNRITSRQFSYQWLRPVAVTVNPAFAPERFKMALNGVAMLGMNYAGTPDAFGIGVDLSAELPSGLRLGVGYAGGSGHFVTVRAGQVLSFRRRRR